jgi:hypothetical protein
MRNVPAIAFKEKKEKKVIFLMLGLSLLYLIFQLLFLDKIPSIMVDEPWYANVGYNFSIGEGLVNTNPGSGTGTGVFLYPLLLGIFFKGVGTSLYTARLFSVIGGLLGLIGLIQILSEFDLRPKVVLLCGLFYVFSNVIYIVFRSVRPDGWILTFVLWGGYFLLTALKKDKDFLFFIAGLFISASFLCHPNGALYIFFFGVITLASAWRSRSLRRVVYYLSGVLFIFIAFFVDRVYVHKQEAFYFVDRWLARTSVGGDEESRVSISMVQNIATFFKTYLVGIKRLFILFFELGVLGVGLLCFRNKALFVTSLVGFCYFVLAIVFLKPFAARHFGEILLFSIITYGLLLRSFEDKRKLYFTFIIFGMLYLLNNMAGDIYLVDSNYDNTAYGVVDKEIDKIVPDGASVLTLMHFWFPLKNNENYNSYTRWRKTNYKNIDELLDSGDLEYVVISNYLTRGLTPTSARKSNLKMIDKQMYYYEKVHNYAINKGKLISALETNNYGQIEIWHVK